MPRVLDSLRVCFIASSIVIIAETSHHAKFEYHRLLGYYGYGASYHAEIS